jgi:hypothetical protein
MERSTSYYCSRGLGHSVGAAECCYSGASARVASTCILVMYADGAAQCCSARYWRGRRCNSAGRTTSRCWIYESERVFGSDETLWVFDGEEVSGHEEG